MRTIKIRGGCQTGLRTENLPDRVRVRNGVSYIGLSTRTRNAPLSVREAPNPWQTLGDVDQVSLAGGVVCGVPLDHQNEAWFYIHVSSLVPFAYDDARTAAV